MHTRPDGERMEERLFRLVHYRDCGPAASVSSSSLCALVWAADQHLPTGCRFVDEVETIKEEKDENNGQCRCAASAFDGGGASRHDGAGSTTLGLADEDETLWGDGQDPGEAFRCGLLWTGVRPLAAHLADILAPCKAKKRRNENEKDDTEDTEDAHVGSWNPRRVVELGAGMGVNGIVAAQLLSATTGTHPSTSPPPLVVVTDYHAAVLHLLRRNVELNPGSGARCGGASDAGGARVIARRLTWGDEAEAVAVKRLTSRSSRVSSSAPSEDIFTHDGGCPQPFHLVLAADIIYNTRVVAPLYRTLGALLRGAPPGARFLMAHTERRRLIPVGAVPGSIPAAADPRGGGGAEEAHAPPPRDEHLDVFLAKAGAYGFKVREIGFERRAGEELVRLFDVRLVVCDASSSSRSRHDEYDVFMLDEQ